MQDFTYAGKEGFNESVRSDVREEAYIRLLMRMMGMDREAAKYVIQQNGGVDSFAKLVQGQTPDDAWDNLQKATTLLDSRNYMNADFGE